MLHVLGEGLTHVLKASQLLQLNSVSAFDRQNFSPKIRRKRSNSVTSFHSQSIERGRQLFEWNEIKNSQTKVRCFTIDDASDRSETTGVGAAAVAANLTITSDGMPPRTPLNLIASPPRKGNVGHIAAFGMLVPVDRRMAFFSTVNATTSGRRARIPDVLNATMRPCSFVEPHTRQIIHGSLLTAGYVSHKELADRMSFAWDSLNIMLQVVL